MFIKLSLLITLISAQVYIEQVMDCVDNTCKSVRTDCGIDNDCRLSYNNFTTCISAQTNEAGYINCRTNGHMAWVNVMDCYNDCQYFNLFGNALLSGLFTMFLV